MRICVIVLKGIYLLVWFGDVIFASFLFYYHLTEVGAGCFLFIVSMILLIYKSLFAYSLLSIPSDFVM